MYIFQFLQNISIVINSSFYMPVCILKSPKIGLDKISKLISIQVVRLPLVLGEEILNRMMISYFEKEN